MAALTRVPVLTYHSVSSEPGPTSMPAATFAMQMETLAELGYQTLGLDDFLAWRADPAPVDSRRVLISFDDAFADFAATAFPILQRHGFSAVVFVPTARLGGREDWRGANHPPRRLMDWDEVVGLSQAGIAFGSHTLSHPDLTTLAPEARRDEIVRSGEMLAERLGRPTRSFAAPYGRVNAMVLAELAGRYEVAFGTRLGLADRSCPGLDVPRIEMHYFREPARWRNFLQGGSGYLRVRQSLRAVRQAAAGLKSGGGVWLNQ